MIRRSLRWTTLVIAFGLLAQPAAAFTEQECAAPERLYSSEPRTVATARSLTAGRHVTVAVLGGASTLGLAAGGLELAWPARLATVLTERFPSAEIQVMNLAVARQTAKRGVERLDRDVIPLKPKLVIWETGTMEAVRRIDVDEFRRTLQAGIDKLRLAGAEVMLMNMQFSPETAAIIQFEPYLVAMRELADGNNIPLFQRYGIMRHWAESGALDLNPGADSEKRRQVAVRLYNCIGGAVANFMTRGQAAKRTSVADLDR